MSKLKCPLCNGDVEVEIVSRDVWKVSCRRCEISYTFDLGPNSDAYEAYEAFLSELKKKGSIVGKISFRREDALERIKEGGGDPKLIPHSFRKILLDNKSGIELVYYRFLPARSGDYGRKVSELEISEPIKKCLMSIGIKRLYRFQEDAINKIMDGRDVIVVAPTGNGKTEAFTIPLLEKVVRWKEEYNDRGPFALLLYPTKALSRDQLEKFKLFESYTGVRFEVFDGDTPKKLREEILSNPPDVIITNPDMIHVHLMLRDRFAKSLSNVRYVVLDELHQYKGSFGTNVHFIIRRLERKIGRIQLVGASATIGNPKEFGKLLFGRDVSVVECKEGKRGDLHFFILYPEYSMYSMIGKIARALYEDGFKTLIFANAHKTAEILCILLKRSRLKCAVHRAGLLSSMRRKIENAFKRGDLKLLISTPTLELGIDIGDLNGVISVLVDYTRLVQRVGRVGRKGQESVAILFLKNEDTISNYYRNHPDQYFLDIASAYLEPKNEIVAYHQILSASLDMPLRVGEFSEFYDIIEKLLRDGLLIKKGDFFIPNWKEAMKVLKNYNIRGFGETVYIKEGERKVGERNMPMAIEELHPGAVYMINGVMYKVRDFKYEQNGVGEAIVEKLPSDYNYITVAHPEIEPRIVEVIKKKVVYGSELLYCKLRIKERVDSYLIKEMFSGRVVKLVSLEKPLEYEFETRGFVFRAPHPKKSVEEFVSKGLSLDILGKYDLYYYLTAGTFHAIEHVIIEGSPMITGGGSREVGGVSMGDSGFIFVYDAIPGGSGISKIIYDRFDEVVERSIRMLKECSCKRFDGCPKCTYSYQCGNNNKPLFKYGAIESFERMLKSKEKTKVDESFSHYRSIV
ncbi:MAG: DEAD/DEAH box helicase [Candidatus Asgardarchaeia archaeon]